MGKMRFNDMKTPTIIGTLIFVISILVVAIAAVQLEFLDPDLAGQQYFELFFIWIAGVVGGIGLGYGSRESFGYSEDTNATIIGGIGLGASIIIAVWRLLGYI
jgi:multisubunit Na+/H+ antiporter MnhG subunit